MRRLAIFALASICWIPLPVLAQEIDAVVGRHVAWRGGVAFQALRSIDRAGEIETAGLRGSISLLERRDGSRRLDYDLGAVKGSETVTPSDAWTTSGSGQIEDLGESLARDAKRALAHDCGLLLRSDESASRTLLGVEERDGKSWQVVRAAFADGGYYGWTARSWPSSPRRAATSGADRVAAVVEAKRLLRPRFRVIGPPGHRIATPQLCLPPGSMSRFNSSARNRVLETTRFPRVASWKLQR